MNLNEYQKEAQKTAIYPEHMRIIYPALGLAGETGEVCEKIKKVYRDCNGIFTKSQKEEIKKELGDALWYIQGIAHDIGATLEDVAITNIEKLRSRQIRNKISGNGDNR